MKTEYQETMNMKLPLDHWKRERIKSRTLSLIEVMVHIFALIKPMRLELTKSPSIS
jgi:hypothetical protein